MKLPLVKLYERESVALNEVSNKIYKYYSIWMDTDKCRIRYIYQKIYIFVKCEMALSYHTFGSIETFAATEQQHPTYSTQENLVDG